MYFLFPQHHGKERFYMTSIGQYINVLPYIHCNVFNSSKMETLCVCEGLLYTGLTAGGWLGCCSTSLGVNELCYWERQTSGQQSATRAMPRTGRGRLPSTERVISRLTQTQQSVLMKSRSLESTAIVFSMDHVV